MGIESPEFASTLSVLTDQFLRWLGEVPRLRLARSAPEASKSLEASQWGLLLRVANVVFGGDSDLRASCHGFLRSHHSAWEMTYPRRRRSFRSVVGSDSRDWNQNVDPPRAVVPK